METTISASPTEKGYLLTMSKSVKKTAGRRTLLNEEMIDRLVGAVRSGNYLDDSARYVGIGERTLFEWLAKGRQALEDADGDLEAVDEDKYLFAQLSQSLESARSHAVVRNVALIQKAAEQSWQAAAWYLERTNPKKWGRFETVELTGANGGAIQVEVSAKETLRAKFEAAERAALEVLDVEPELEMKQLKATNE
jgi:hypothetical protein